MSHNRLKLAPLPASFAEELRGLTVNAHAQNLDASEAIEVEAPFLGENMGWVGKGSADDVDSAFALARRAHKAWAATPIKERAEIFSRFHDIVLKNRELIMDMIQLEMGKARAGAFDEVTDVANNSRYYANNAHKFLKPRRRTGGMPVLTKTYLHYFPKGVVGQISPWNYPFTLGISDAIPAMIAGNTVVSKPDSSTPFSSLLAAKLLREAGLPDGVFNIVTGSGSVVGSGIADHCDFLMFTGSTATGKVLGEQVGKRLVGYSAELGGKNPLIVGPDANLDTAIRGIIHACLSNTGQLCVSIERIYVHADIYDDFRAHFVNAVNDSTLGSGLNWKYQVGSLASKQQIDTVTEFIDDAKAKGATILTGGNPRPDIGPYFFEPTVVTDVADDVRLRTEEVFGPVIHLEKVDSMDEAIRKANDTRYGLNSSVFAASKTAWEVAPRIEAGSVNINDGFIASFASIDSPIGGVKESGMSRRHGKEGMLKYTEPKTISEQRVFPIWGPKHMSAKAWSTMLSTALLAGKKTGLLK